MVRRRRRRRRWHRLAKASEIYFQRNPLWQALWFYMGSWDENCAMGETCQACLRRRQLARIGIHWKYLDEDARSSSSSNDQQLAGIKYSHSEVHKIIIAPQQLGKTLTVRPLDVDVHAHPHAAHHGLHVVRHLHLLAAVGLSGLNFTSHFTFPNLTVQPHSTLGSLTSFKTGPLTARCKEFTH